MLFCGDVAVARRNVLARVPAGCPDWPESDAASVQGNVVDATGAPVSGIAAAVATAASSLSTRPNGSGGISGHGMLCTPLSRTARRCDSERRQRRLFVLRRFPSQSQRTRRPRPWTDVVIPGRMPSTMPIPMSLAATTAPLSMAWSVAVTPVEEDPFTT